MFPLLGIPVVTNISDKFFFEVYLDMSGFVTKKLGMQKYQ
jgi:hypothetical protein